LAGKNGTIAWAGSEIGGKWAAADGVKPDRREKHKRGKALQGNRVKKGVTKG
jgi:hypothetical protein